MMVVVEMGVAVKQEETPVLPRFQRILERFSMEDKMPLVGRDVYIPLSCRHVLDPFASQDEMLLVRGG
jgi:hypothetical protein